MEKEKKHRPGGDTEVDLLSLICNMKKNMD